MKISVEANRPYRSAQRRGRPLEKGGGGKFTRRHRVTAGKQRWATFYPY